MAADRTTPEATRRACVRAGLAAGLLLASALSFAPSALAGIVIEPDAPAGVQYQAPLDRERAKATDGGDAGAPGSSEVAAAFGEGVAPAPGARGGGGGPGAATADPLETVEVSTGSQQTLKVGALALSALAAGGALGLLLGRRRDPRPG